MSETEAKEAKPAKKPRAKRKASDFLVLCKQDDSEDGVEMHDYSTVADGASIKACMKTITEKKIVGELLIVCVRRRLTSEVEERVKLS